MIRLAYRILPEQSSDDSLHPEWQKVKLRARAVQSTGLDASAVHGAGCLSSPNLVPEAWGVPQEPQAFIPCWKAEAWVLISSRDGCSADSDSGRSSWEMNSPVRHKNKQAKSESCSRWAAARPAVLILRVPTPTGSHIRYFHCDS